VSRSVLLLALLVASLPKGASAQLSLAEALAEADAGAFANRMAAGEARADAAGAVAALRGILPSVRFEAGYLRTTDPIGVFGATLRQRSVTPAAFDPARLNFPEAIGDYTGAAIAEIPLVNVDAWLGRGAARAAADASDAGSEWTRLRTRRDVVRAYYGAALAGERAQTYAAAHRAATSHLEQVRAMRAQGLVTKADELQASVRLGDVEANWIASMGEAEMARRQLATLLGRDDEGIPVAGPLPATAVLEELLAADTTALAASEGRRDVVAAELAAEAAAANLRRSRSNLLPRINALARYDWHSSSTLYGGEPSWSVGLMASWSPFSGGGQFAARQEAAGRAEAARAGADAVRAQANLDHRSARTVLRTALARLSIADRSVEQADEALRLVRRRYEGGLATITELLAADAAATGARLGASAARHAVIDASATLRLALGRDPGSLVVLEQTSSSTGAIR
jgi:outer membrane protein TolC